MACLTSFVSSNALPHFPLIPVCPPLSSPRALRRGTKPSYFFSKCFYLLFQHFFFLLHELFCIFISWHLESCKIYSINGFIVERQKTKLSRNSSPTFSREHRFSCVLNLSDLSKPAEQFFFFGVYVNKRAHVMRFIVSNLCSLSLWNGGYVHVQKYTAFYGGVSFFPIYLRQWGT